MEDARMIRIARALCRSARIDPDSVLAGNAFDAGPAKDDRRQSLADAAVPAWTLFRGAALTFIQSQD